MRNSISKNLFKTLTFGIWHLAFLLLLSCGPAKPAIRVGMDLSYPPFEFKNDAGQPAGISPDLARELAYSLGRPVEIINLPFGELIPSLQASKIDLIISSMTRTDERSQIIQFSDPYVETGLCLLVRRYSGIASITDVDRPDKNLVVMEGTTGHRYAEKNLRQAKVLPLRNEADCVFAVVNGDALAFAFDQMSVFKNAEKNSASTTPILAPFQKESWAIGMRRGDLNLLRDINAFLADFRKRGGFERLGDQYLSAEKKAFKERGYPFFF